MRVNDANTRVRCNYPQLNSLLLYLSQLGREIVKTNISIFSFFLSFLLSFPVSRQSRSRMEKKKKIKFLDFEITEGKKEETNENVRIESVSLFLSGRERRYCTETQHEIPMDGMEKLLKCNTNISN